MTAVLLSFATFGSTLGGALFALNFRDRLHYLLSLGFQASQAVGKSRQLHAWQDL